MKQAVEQPAKYIKYKVTIVNLSWFDRTLEVFPFCPKKTVSITNAKAQKKKGKKRQMMGENENIH